MTPSRLLRGYTPVVIAIALGLGAGVARSVLHSGPWPSIATAAGVLAVVIFVTVGFHGLLLIARERPHVRRRR